MVEIFSIQYLVILLQKREILYLDRHEGTWTSSARRNQCLLHITDSIRVLLNSSDLQINKIQLFSQEKEASKGPRGTLTPFEI